MLCTPSWLQCFQPVHWNLYLCLLYYNSYCLYLMLLLIDMLFSGVLFYLEEYLSSLITFPCTIIFPEQTWIHLYLSPFDYGHHHLCGCWTWPRSSHCSVFCALFVAVSSRLYIEIEYTDVIYMVTFHLYLLLIILYIIVMIFCVFALSIWIFVYGYEINLGIGNIMEKELVNFWRWKKPTELWIFHQLSADEHLWTVIC